MVKAKKSKISNLASEFGKQSFKIRFVEPQSLCESNQTLICENTDEADFLQVAAAFQKSQGIRLIKQGEGEYLVRETGDGVAYGILFRKMFSCANTFKKSTLDYLNKERSIRIKFVNGKEIYDGPESTSNFFVVDEEFCNDFLEAIKGFGEEVYSLCYTDGTYGVFYGSHVSFEDAKLFQTPFDRISHLYRAKAHDFKEHQKSLEHRNREILIKEKVLA